MEYCRPQEKCVSNLGEMVNWYTDPAVTRGSFMANEGSNPSSPTKCAYVL